MERVHHFCTFRTYAMHIVSDVHHYMHHTPFSVYVVQDCQTMGWQAGCVLTFISAWECTRNGTHTSLVHYCSPFMVLICPQRSPDIHQEQTKRRKWCNNHSSRLRRQATAPKADNGCRAQGCYKWDTIS
jgi:hypothetical protein